MDWAWSDFEYALHVAHLLAAAGDADGTIRWLTRAVDLGYINYPFLSEYDGALDFIRTHPDFTALMERVRREWESFDG